jgi:hypothetical protein
MTHDASVRCIAFEGSRFIASGEIREIALQVKAVHDRGACSPILVFDEASSHPVELDLRGTVEEVLARLPAPEPEAPRKPGRPKLGVVAREVTLLPRHWEWLASQPGGASVALRKLVEEARLTHAGRDRLRLAQESAHRFMSAMAGNEPGFEEALRALYAAQPQRFDEMTAVWPAGVRHHARRLVAACWPRE